MPVTHDRDDYSFAPAMASPASVSVTHYSKIVHQSPDTSTLYRSRYSAEEASDEAYQTDLQNRRFQLRKRRVILVSITALSMCMISMLVRVNKYLSGINISGFTIRMSAGNEAARDSNGFFDDVPNENWEQRKQQTRSKLREQDALNADLSVNNVEPKAWWLKNWQANFPCYQEVRIRNKFICDPFRIVAQTIQHLNSKEKGIRCIVYVSGGDEIGFANQFLDFASARVMEVGLTAPVCDVHIFNPNSQQAPQRDNLILHNWGFKPKNVVNSTITGAYKTIETTLQELGHSEQTISILALDCEACEWDIYHDLLSLKPPINQILMQMHGVPNPNQAQSTFNAMRFAGYVITHKEEDAQGGGEVYDYSFLRLSPSYFGPDR